MKTLKRLQSMWTLAVVSVATVGLTVGSADAAQIFFDDFSGGAATELHGTTPDVTPSGESWIARSTFKADGSFSWKAMLP